MSKKIESAVDKMDQMIHDAINSIDPTDDVYLASAIIQANKNARFPGYGMAVTSGLLAKRDAAIRKAAMEEADNIFTRLKKLEMGLCAEPGNKWSITDFNLERAWFGSTPNEAISIAEEAITCDKVEEAV